MTLFGTLALLSWIAFFGSVLWGLTIQFKIVEAVNSKRPGEESLDMFSNLFRGITHYKVFSLYRAYFPEGKLLRKYWLITFVGVFWFGLAAAFLFQAINHTAR
jgi:hypothetical protein